MQNWDENRRRENQIILGSISKIFLSAFFCFKRRLKRRLKLRFNPNLI